MTTRQEDELDLKALSIAKMVKHSDNLRIPRNPEKAGQALIRTVNDIVRIVRKDGAA